MRLALLTDYALRTLIYLAGRADRARIDEVAEFYRISVHHVAKVVNLLARRGLIRSIRGVGGGIEMARPAEAISIGEVVATIEGNTHLLECVATEGVCVIQPGCRLRAVLAKAETLQMDFLRQVRLSDVVRPAGQLKEFVPLAALQTPPRVSASSTLPPRSPPRKSRPKKSP